ncbi:glycoside hydrolase 43 family protein [Opitutus sp. ER46]|uniref:glycoside hydrolase family 43 protein n=1 Tax=Opitutus sp. ER46 TaxID=2161864 RepID=UPI000D2F938E|nr:glycoside hydrolase 43 family protein [Opitutus sp. ER46]PTX94510.1 glycoside hydrolase [Opitutus sp. ER46]
MASPADFDATNAAAAAHVLPPPAWVSDAGDGTYRNPVLCADYSDPDAIRVGDDFWLTASSFGHAPGLPILHSRDLVNWTLVNHALPQLTPVEHFKTPRHGGGVWAPSIRHHAGKFWIYYPDPDFGLYVVTADDPRGQWSAPTLVLGGKGLIDPCPLWDADGQGYLVHGWAKSRAGICNRVTLHKLSADGLRTVDEGKVIIDADKLTGWQTLEGPKLYRRGEYYFVFAPAGGVATGYQAVFRSKNIYGPYDSRIVLEQGRTPINGPHQGAWIDTPTGQHWFLHFQDLAAYGRIMHLQPMQWDADGWPSMGTPGVAGVGEPVLRHVKPGVAPAPIAVPATSDDFRAAKLGLQWQWQANPETSWLELRPKDAGLRLHAVPAPADANSLWLAPNLLLQKFPAPRFVTTTQLSFAPAAEGETAGLVVFGYSYAWLGLRRTAEGLALVHVTCNAAQEGNPERELARVPAKAAKVWLRVSVGDDATCAFSYSFDGDTYQPIGAAFHATVSKWVGAKVGLFAQAPAGTTKRGYADFAWFDVAPGK